MPHPSSGFGRAMDAPAAQGLTESSAAAAAREHLRGVEKHLDNEGLLFSKETVQLLENAIKAIRELEEERKHTLDLLEEETIKNCNLRVKIKGYPEMIMKEFEELVAAARRTRFQKLKEMEISMNEFATAVESTYSKQKLSEEVNVVLCEEQQELRNKYEEIVNLMNQRMGAKHSVNIEINELHNLKKEEEEEIVLEEMAIREMKEEMKRETSDFRERKRLLDEQIEDIRRKIEEQKNLAKDKGEEYAELCTVLEALEKEIAAYNQSIAAGREELAELFRRIREMLKEYEEKKKEKEDLIKKKAQLEAEQSALDVGFDEEKEELLRKLKEAEQKLQGLLKINAKLKDENNLLNIQYQALLDEEYDFCGQRDRLAREFEKLSNLLTDRLDKVGKHLLETKDLQEELDRLQEVFDTTQCGYSREIGNLEATLQKEGDKRAGLQDQLADITARYQKMMDDHNELLNSSKQKSAAAKKLLSELTRENERLKKEVQKSLDVVKQLTEKLRKREAYYKKRDAALEAEIKNLEEELSDISQRLQEKEALLNINRPLAEKLELELEEKRANFSNQKDTYSALLEEERTLTKSIERSLREISKLKRMKFAAKNEIQANREVMRDQLIRFTHTLKLLERENYEMDRVMYILNAENDRLRAGIAFLREDIATMESEGEVYRSKRQKNLKEVKILHERFDMRWFKDRFLHQMFLKYEHEVMNRLEEHLARNKKRIETLDYVHDGLQLNCDAMELVFKNKSVLKSPSTDEEMPDTVA